MEFEQFVRPELLVLVPVLYLIGAALKKSAAVADRWIPLLLGGIGVVLAVAYMLVFPSELTAGQCILTGAIQGVLCTGLSVYGNQMVKQMTKEE